MLTQKQYDLLIYVNKNLKEKGYCPSYEEMKAHLGLHSKSGIHRLIKGLEERKFVKRLANKARSLEVLMLPSDKYITPTKTTKPDVQPLAQKAIPISNDNIIDIPLYGKIAAGTPIEAIRNPSDTVAIPAQMLGAGDHYALKIEGDSMIEAGIMDGDTVIIKRAEQAPNNAIAVALVDGFEVTLKRIQTKGNQISLIPENKEYKTRIFEAGRIEIQGLLVGLMRSYH